MMGPSLLKSGKRLDRILLGMQSTYGPLENHRLVGSCCHQRSRAPKRHGLVFQPDETPELIGHAKRAGLVAIEGIGTEHYPRHAKPVWRSLWSVAMVFATDRSIPITMRWSKRNYGNPLTKRWSLVRQA